MKLISDKASNLSFKYYLKNFFRDVLIICAYTLGFCAYALVFLSWTVNFKTLSYGWITIPVLGFVMGLIHIGYIYKGSLLCKAIVMFSIMLYIFIVPLVIAFIN